MNVLLIGSGGREHALAYKIKESKNLGKLFILPGNPGTKSLGQNIEDIDQSEFNAVVSFCLEKKVELVVVGPEQPLVIGLADYLRQNNILVFGPNKNAAEIEAHKTFAKWLMTKYNIPTASYAEFSSIEIDKAKEYVAKLKLPCVIKADGLAAGKGVIICNEISEANRALEEILVDKIFGQSGEKIIIEEFLQGEEASIFAVTDGANFICLPAAQDHKRIGDNDTGKNTGGMGAYSPAPIITKEILNEVEKKIISPTLNAMISEDRKFVGCLYCGLMLTSEGPRVIEFNCRFGDPETQAVLPILEGDFLQLLYSAAMGNLDKNAIKYSGGAAVCVVAASKGYPDSFTKGYEISGLENQTDGIIIFHAGTKEIQNKIITNGGRVLGVTSVIKTNDLKLAKKNVYSALEKINFKDIYFRKDIADKALRKLE
ncbi:MAG: phosphoribosylamine--glycine ligase [Bacteroidetes bacterium]|nr:phosphoribosylamine--glycine ligase [Bacteroidota bacterium]